MAIAQIVLGAVYALPFGPGTTVARNPNGVMSKLAAAERRQQLQPFRTASRLRLLMASTKAKLERMRIDQVMWVTPICRNLNEQSPSTSIHLPSYSNRNTHLEMQGVT